MLVLPLGHVKYREDDFRQYSEQEAYLIALEHFEDSFGHFKQLNHLAGMYLSRREAATLCGLINNEEKHQKYAADYS